MATVLSSPRRDRRPVTLAYYTISPPSRAEMLASADDRVSPQDSSLCLAWELDHAALRKPRPTYALDLTEAFLVLRSRRMTALVPRRISEREQSPLPLSPCIKNRVRHVFTNPRTRLPVHVDHPSTSRIGASLTQVKVERLGGIGRETAGQAGPTGRVKSATTDTRGSGAVTAVGPRRGRVRSLRACPRGRRFSKSAIGNVVGERQAVAGHRHESHAAARRGAAPRRGSRCAARSGGRACHRASARPPRGSS